jgi:hypothetical protein
VVAGSDEEALVPPLLAVEEIQRVDHRHTGEVLAHHRGEEEIAGVQHQHRPAFALELSPQGTDAGETALGAGAQAFDLVGIVDLEKRGLVAGSTPAACGATLPAGGALAQLTSAASEKTPSAAAGGGWGSRAHREAGEGKMVTKASSGRDKFRR